MPLSREEREHFLAQPHVAALAVERGPDHGPLVVPIWYGYEPGGDVWIDTETESLKARRIRAAGRFSLMVDRVEPTPRYVSVAGPVSAVEPLTSDMHRAMAARYLAGPELDAYCEWFEASLGDSVRISMRPGSWFSADLGLS
ncbi:pyridoxamine 5'-phosphate oxidase family protein [Hoyosella sp. YIM 151337]|uniref:pyridoxamine 5'-phosphate oxidase family protein n=1 Tax=Hoyosella sp. YIM 151337 TaxID=2992742 RepID=UPI002235BD0C|nr:pyridoxamine 5'-phosphate oxidase family protein [Hoyosella sp. YIM 151337]MCW4355077.1 pyridoxamine 5'-phosphate oxidase family protein [Hoyosella sp. YIM 151337]